MTYINNDVLNFVEESASILRDKPEGSCHIKLRSGDERFLDMIVIKGNYYYGNYLILFQGAHYCAKFPYNFSIKGDGSIII